jgi:hypothetical protein
VKSFGLNILHFTNFWIMKLTWTTQYVHCWTFGKFRLAMGQQSNHKITSSNLVRKRFGSLNMFLFPKFLCSQKFKVYFHLCNCGFGTSNSGKERHLNPLQHSDKHKFYIPVIMPPAMPKGSIACQDHINMSLKD